MENNYKRTVAGSVGAGMEALFNASGRKYYILEHKTESKYHSLGEVQKIIVDQIEMGRDSSCQVRFDESMETVSRRHAAIVRDGENYKLIPLSKTNITLVNGQVVTGEWHLNSGDEIRLSSRGPLMGFIIPQGKQSLVKSIGLTERMSLFSQQALRPYKVALVTLIIIMLLAIGALVAWNLYQAAQYEAKNNEIAQEHQELVKQITESETVTIDNVAKYANSVHYIKHNNIAVYTVPGNRLVVDFNVENHTQHGGTGFMLNDGRFVTAHRVLEPWLYYNITAYDNNGKRWAYRDIRRAVARGEYRVVANFTAYSPAGTNFQFKNTDFSYGDGYAGSGEFSGDWATMAKRDQLAVVEGLSFNNDMSVNPVGGKSVNILGYPFQKGFVDSQTISPICQQNNINVSGLTELDVIELSSRRYQEGNDGAPVVQLVNGEWTVIGILSHSDEFDRDVVVPIAYTKK